MDSFHYKIHLNYPSLIPEVISLTVLFCFKIQFVSGWANYLCTVLNIFLILFQELTISRRLSLYLYIYKTRRQFFLWFFWNCLIEVVHSVSLCICQLYSHIPSLQITTRLFWKNKNKNARLKSVYFSPSLSCCPFASFTHFSRKRQLFLLHLQKQPNHKFSNSDRATVLCMSAQEWNLD